MEGWHDPMGKIRELEREVARLRDAEVIADVLAAHAGCVANDSRSQEWIDGSAVTGMDVWSCGIELPYVDDLDAMGRAHLAAALAVRAEGSR